MLSIIVSLCEQTRCWPCVVTSACQAAGVHTDSLLLSRAPLGVSEARQPSCSPSLAAAAPPHTASTTTPPETCARTHARASVMPLERTHCGDGGERRMGAVTPWKRSVPATQATFALLNQGLMPCLPCPLRRRRPHSGRRARRQHPDARRCAAQVISTRRSGGGGCDSGLEGGRRWGAPCVRRCRQACLFRRIKCPLNSFAMPCVR